MTQTIIILRGPAASGKSTISRSLCDFDQKIAWLKVDNFKDFFGEHSDAALPYVNGSAIATMKYLVEQGFSVVIDGVFQDTSAIKEAEEYAKGENIPFAVFELETSLETLKQRDLTRPGVAEGQRKPLGKEIISRIYQKLKDNPYSGATKLNTESHSLEECSEILEKYLNS